MSMVQQTGNVRPASPGGRATDTCADRITPPTRLARRAGFTLLLIAVIALLAGPSRLGAQPEGPSGGLFGYTSFRYEVTDQESSTPPGGEQRASIRGALITVTRTPPARGKVLLDVFTITPEEIGTNDMVTAVPGEDYDPYTNTLVFDDYQMSTNFIITVDDGGSTNAFKMFDLGMANVRPAPEENPAEIVPAIDPDTSFASVRIDKIYNESPAAGTNLAQTFSFERANYRVREDQGNVVIAVVRPRGGSTEKVTVNVHPFTTAVMAGSSAASYGGDYDSPNGRTFDLEFGDNVTRRTFTLDVVDDDLVEFNEDFVITLSPNDHRGNLAITSVTILYDEQPAGAMDRTWNPDRVGSQTPPGNPNPGANGIVQAVAIQPDGRAVIGGQFTAYNTVPRNFLTRVLTNGFIDLTFMAAPNTGPNSVVNAIALYPQVTTNDPVNILIGGGFTSFNGVLRRGVARIDSTGTLDPSFNPGNGMDGTVYAVVLQDDGKVLVAGDFFTVNDEWQPFLARLNEDGSLDGSFRPQVDWPVYALALDGNQRILAGGDFFTVNNEVRPGVARLWPDGAVDLGFNPRGGTDLTVYALAVQPDDNRVLLAGAFTSVDFRPRNRIARLLEDGSLDLEFDPGIGANDNINTLTLEPDGRIYIGGSFTTYNYTRRIGLARLFPDGTLDTSFMDAAYNQYAGFINEFSFQPNNFVNAIGREESGNLIVGGRFQRVGGNARDPLYTRADKRTRFNVTRILGGETGGPGNLGFRDPSYTVDENGIVLRVTITRINGGLGGLSALAGTAANTATADEDYTEIFGIPVGSGSGDFVIPILDDTIQEGNETVSLGLTQPIATLSLVGEWAGINGALHRAQAVMTIVDNDFRPGRFRFSSASFSTNENGRFGVITVERIEGSDGSVSVDYFTADGTATSPADYTPRSGTLFFTPNQLSRTFLIPIFNDNAVEDDETVILALTNATGGAELDFSSVDPSFDPGTGANGPVWATAVQTNVGSVGKVILGGDFTTYDGEAHARIIRLNPDGSVDGGFSGTASANGPVRAVAVQSDGQVLIGGEFNIVSGAPAPRLARLSESGELDQLDFDIRTGPNDTVRALAVETSGNILVGGDFTQFDGDPAHPYLVRLASDGSIDGTFAVELDGPVRDLLVQTNGSILVAGDFSSVNGNSGFNGLVRLLPDGSEDFLFTPDLAVGGSVHSVALLNDGRMVVGGKRIADGPSPHLVRLTRFGGRDDSFNVGAGPNAPVYSVGVHTLGIYTNSVFIGGAFTAVNGEPRPYLARLLADGTVDPAVNPVPGVNGLVWSLTVQTDNRVLFGGDFSQVSYLSRLNVARLSPAASALTIVDDDFSAGRLSFTSLGYTTNESAPAALIGVKRGGGNLGRITVEAMTTFGSATAGEDYVAVTNTLAWDSGDSDTRILVVPLVDNLVAEPLETVNLVLANPSVPGALGTIAETVLAIEDDDFPGSFRFTTANYAVAESSGSAVITVIRSGGTAGAASIAFATSAGTAAPGTHYTETNGVLNYAAGESSKAFRVAIADDSAANANRTINLTLSAPLGADLGEPAAALLTIIDNESVNSPAGSVDTTFDTENGANASVFAVAVQPDDKVLMAGDFTQVNNISRNRVARLTELGVLDTSFNIADGPDAPARALALQPDGKILIGGFFTAIGQVNRGHIARLNIDGTLDNSFEPGGGADGAVYALALTPEGKVVMAGDFTRVDGIVRPNVALLEANGRLASGFNAGIGPDDVVFAVALQSDGKVLVGGEFTSVNNEPRLHLARLHRDGSLDLTFDPGAALNGTVRSLVVQSDGRILAGGSFTEVGGSGRNYLARFNADGTLDESFLAGESGGNNAVFALGLQIDEKIVAVGEFTEFNGVTRHRLTRLNQDGSTDPTINFGTGANAFVAATALDSQNRIIVGGGFTRINGTSRQRIARLYGGAITGPGQLEFSQPNFDANEFVTNAVLSVRRIGGTEGIVSVRQVSRSGTAVAGEDYLDATNTLTFPPGEVLQQFVLPVIDDAEPEAPETVALSLDTPQGATLGPQPVATMTIISDDSVLSFDRRSYREPENTISGRATLTVLRQFATNSVVSVHYQTTTNFPVTTVRPADPGSEYVPTNGVLTFAVGETQKNLFVKLTDNGFADGNKTLAVQLSDPAAVEPSHTAILGALDQALLTIVDNEVSEGRFNFSQRTYQSTEGVTNVLITVQRDNGSSGIVAVDYRTGNGTAIPALDYESTAGTIAFADGENLHAFSVRLFDDALRDGTKTIPLILENPTGGARLGFRDTAELTILDDEPAPAFISFSTNQYDVLEDQPVVGIVVARRQNTNLTVSVGFHTQDGSAVADQDYLSTNGVLTFQPGEIFKNFSVPILNNTVVQSNRTVLLVLTNASEMALLEPPTIAVLTIEDEDTEVGFLPARLAVAESFTNVLITVVRGGRTNRTVTVDYTTAGGTATPGTNFFLPGTDYFPTNGTLTFVPGETSLTFAVTVLDDFAEEGDETVLLTLSNLVGEASFLNDSASLTILDDDASPGTLSFSAPAYRVSEQGGEALVTVQRTNGTSGRITVEFATDPRSATAGLDYNPRSGLLTFRTGETSQTIRIPVLEDNLVEGDEEFSVRLFSVGGGAQLSGPAVVAVTIEDANVGVGSLDRTFDPGLGANDAVRALAVQPDGRILLGGAFTNVAGAPRKYVARLLSTGALDTNFLAPFYVTNVVGWVTNFITNEFTFEVTVEVTNDLSLQTNLVARGANGNVTSIAVQDTGKIVLGGAFTEVNRTNRNRIARLLPDDGAVDPIFYQSNTLNAAVTAIAPLPGGKLLAGGGFSRPVAGIVRLRNDASADVSFDPAAGVDGVVNALAWDAERRQVLIGGAFSNVNLIARSQVARLLDYGALDDAFRPPTIATGAVFAVAVQPDGKVIIGGDFTTIGGTNRNRIARLNADGSLDLSFDPGAGADAPVYALALQPDGKVVLGGDFLNVAGTNRTRIARLNADGSLDFGFEVPQGANGAVFAVVLQPDYKILIGGRFSRVSGVARAGIARIESDLIPAITIQPGVQLTGAAFRFSFTSQPGGAYALETSTNLVDWTVLRTNVAAGPITDFTDPDAGASAWRFYRVRQVTP